VSTHRPLVAIALALAALLVAALFSPTARADAPPTIAVRVAIDDRVAGRLVSPVLAVDQAGLDAVPFTDDGAVPGDVVKDGILMATADAARHETLRFTVLDQGEALATFDVVLPSSGGADFALKSTTGSPAVVLDLAAPAMPGGSGLTALDGDPSGGDRIHLRVVVDDRAVVRLQEPTLVVDQTGVDPMTLLDDGSLDGDVANDRVFVSEVDVGRAQYLTLYVEDRGVSVGSVKVFLPSTSDAEVNLLTVDGATGLELKSEPTATSSTDSPSTSAAATGGGSDRFVHVLWIGIGLFAMGFAYLRVVVATRWDADVRPLLERQRRFLDRAEGEGQQDEPGANE
jgi:hypothetical protein